MTAAFQGNAFQNDSFQMGSPAAPTETAVIQISDGNDTVMILHEQDQHTDHLGTSALGQVAEDFTRCVYPDVKSITTGSDGAGTTHIVDLPSYAVGDRIIILISNGGGGITSSVSTTGWVEFGSQQQRFGASYKDMESTDGSTITISTPGSAEIAFVYYVLRAGTFNAGVAPQKANGPTGATTNPDPPNLTTAWPADKSLWIAAYGTGGNPVTTVYPYPLGNTDYNDGTGNAGGGTCHTFLDAQSDNPGAFTIDSSLNQGNSTIAVLGFCDNPIYSAQCLDTQDFTDLEDYGSYTAALGDDAAPAGEDFLLGTGDGLDTQDFTDEADYGDFVEPAIPDNNPDVAPSSLDDQDFTDTEDYGYLVAPLSDNNNPEVSVAAVALDDQDFTDLFDYGYTQAAAPDLDDQDPDLAQVDCDSQDFTDLEDYSLVVAPLSDDNNPEIAPSSLDDQDFTDFTDYSDYVLQLSEDFVLREDFILGDGQGLDAQDFTDLEDYGSVTAPLSDDSVDFLLGTGDGLDFQDFTDTEDYSYTLAPLSGDNNPEVAPSSLDDQDFTDLEDYGSTTPQAVPDNNPVIAPSDLDSQDFTDLTDYGDFVAPAIPDNNPDIAPSNLDDQDFTDLADYGDVVQQAIEDNNPEIAPSSLDDQDFTDTADYGSFTPQPNDEFIAPEDFILGDGKGLDTQDFTDYTDYGYAAWLTPENVTEVYVNGVLITVSIGCFHIDAWQVISDPSTSWSGIAEPSTLWNGIPDVSTVWSTPSDGTTDWTEIPNPSTSWTEEC